MKSVSIVGGGVAGLVAAIQLARAGIPCTLFERKSYPFHRVCGEYISNEAAPFLRSTALYPSSHSPVRVNRFMLSSIDGSSQSVPLDLGGFGISRFTFDNFLFEKAIEAGATVRLNTTVESVEFLGQSFRLSTGSDIHECDVVIAAHGKRSALDVKMKRAFTHKRSPFLGVKYHVRYNHPTDLVALHNFPGGYCGVNRVENNVVNLCYLVQRDQLKKYGSIAAMEENVLFQNPILKKVFIESEFLFTKPETINEVSFETKQPVEDHLLMIGDSAGMIAPLCGNGMAMAIHSSMLVSRVVRRFCSDDSYSRAQMEQDYIREWSRNFKTRLWVGRQIQRLFGSNGSSSLAVRLLSSRRIANLIIRNTHGKPFE